MSKKALRIRGQSNPPSLFLPGTLLHQHPLIYLSQPSGTDLGQLLRSSCLFMMLAASLAHGLLRFFFEPELCFCCLTLQSSLLKLLNCSVHSHCCLRNGSKQCPASKSPLLFVGLYRICNLAGFPPGKVEICGPWEMATCSEEHGNGRENARHQAKSNPWKSK